MKRGTDRDRFRHILAGFQKDVNVSIFPRCVCNHLLLLLLPQRVVSKQFVEIVTCFVIFLLHRSVLVITAAECTLKSHEK